MRDVYRRASSLVCYWRDGRLLIEHYARRETIEATPLILELLDGLTTWRAKPEIRAGLARVPAHLLDDLIDALVGHGIIERSSLDQEHAADRGGDAAPTGGRTVATTRAKRARQAERALDTWAAWMPAAYFHLATKDVPFTPREETIRRLRQRAAEAPPPSPLKLSDARVRVALPAARRTGVLPEVLVARRTWRRFGATPLTLDALGTLLGLTWGVQDWIDVDGWGRMPLKTAPSGGARHSVEAYVLARDVRGLRQGLYHYQPAAHELHLVRARAATADIRAYLPEQGWYGKASALVLMTAVFPRVQWRYPFARAYRTVLAEVGHHCQTFCLVATWLGLAPFCTMALADSRIERDLGIDGVTESVLYAAGVGSRPAGVAWAPWPETTDTPSRTPNDPRCERASTASADGRRARRGDGRQAGDRREL